MDEEATEDDEESETDESESTSSRPTTRTRPTTTVADRQSTEDETDVDPATVAGNIEVDGDLVPGGVIIVRGTGFAPDAEFVIEVHSEPRELTTAGSDASGDFAVEATIPDDLEPGLHTVVVLVGDVELASSRIAVSAPPGAGGAVAALWLLGGLALAAALLLGYTVLRSRRRQNADTVDTAADGTAADDTVVDTADGADDTADAPTETTEILADVTADISADAFVDADDAFVDAAQHPR